MASVVDESYASVIRCSEAICDLSAPFINLAIFFIRLALFKQSCPKFNYPKNFLDAFQLAFLYAESPSFSGLVPHSPLVYKPLVHQPISRASFMENRFWRKAYFHSLFRCA